MDLELEILGYLDSGGDKKLLDSFSSKEEKLEFLLSFPYQKHLKSIEKEINDIKEPPKLEEGIFQCVVCGCNKTYSYCIQLRSCDEPMSTIITCSKCFKTWRKD